MQHFVLVHQVEVQRQQRQRAQRREHVVVQGAGGGVCHVEEGFGVVVLLQHALPGTQVRHPRVQGPDAAGLIIIKETAGEEV